MTGMRKRISEEEIFGLYLEFKTPGNVMRHCNAVANVATTIAAALDEHGFDLDLELIHGAGLAHDAARTQARHWDVAADRLADMGYIEESIIVRNHMTGAGYHDISEVSEMDMIWLGDRLVREDEYVGIDERFDYIIEKALKMGAEDHVKDILASKADMQRLLDQIEKVIGQSVDSLFEVKEDNLPEEGVSNE